jgi:cytochrome c peroxidase
LYRAIIVKWSTPSVYSEAYNGGVELFKMKTSLIQITIFGLALSGAGCAPKPAPLDDAQLKVFAPLPASIAAKPGGPVEARVALGRMLYYDARLSRSQTVSCNSCHDLARYGVDGEPTSKGHRGQRGDRNSPTVYNAAAHFAQFWDGRAPDVEAQAKGPMLNPIEMALPDDKAAVAVLKSMPDYVAAFKAAFPADNDPVTFDNMALAIGTFERGLLTPSRWDRFLAGDKAALTAEEQAGAHVFLTTGCAGCHAGMLLGGNLYQKLGAAAPYPDTSDAGRYKVTNAEADRMLFKVPSLRNAARTAPYFHNGKIASLDIAVAQMAEYQLGRQLTTSEIASIVTFLNALTGDLPAQYIQRPELPKSTPKTPKGSEAD